MQPRQRRPGIAAPAVAALAVVAAAAACRGEAPAPTAPPPPPVPVAARDAGPRDAPATADDPLGAASLMADVEWLAAPARHGRGSRSADARAVAAWLGDELRQAGYAPTTLAIPEVDDQVDVVAVYGPRDDLAPTIVVTAHYDHLGEVDGTLYPGADDNASGVAVALGVARDLAARRDVAGRVVFVFTGAEELGLYGARAYAEAPAYPLGQTRVVINLDMVGRRFFEGTADQDATLGAVGLPGDATLLELGEAAAAAAGVALVAVSAELLTLVGEDWRSDDWVFRDRGVPAVHLSTGLNPDYHQPTDTPDRVSRAQLERVARFLRGWVSRLAAR